MEKVNIFWFRRDLRLDDNAGLSEALRSGRKVVPVFIFDRDILDALEDRDDKRVAFIQREVERMHRALRELGSGLRVYQGHVREVWREILEEWPVEAIFTNRDYEPAAIARDADVKQMAEAAGAAFHDFKDQVIFERQEVLTGQGGVYTVFTPYSRKWRAALQDADLAERPVMAHAGAFYAFDPGPVPTLEDLGFVSPEVDFPTRNFPEEIIRSYDATRDFPAQEGTSRMGIHLRFGTVSIRRAVRNALKWNDVYLNELIWREFYMQILANHPRVTEESFRPEYDAILWRNDAEAFEAWKAGKTGYPLVDAGMRQLRETGYMHNRVRMVTASFLTKHLLIDWRWGEAWFARWLLDFELASNNGGWQWAAGCGTDAAPYFRIFNPESQMKKFDPKGTYVRRWVPEYGTPAYARPIVDHATARERCLSAYKSALSGD